MLYKYFKLATVLIVIAAIFFFFFQFRSCFGGKVSKSDTVSHRIDTVFVRTTDTVLFDNPIPYRVEYVKEKILHDTLESIETILQHVDSAKILSQYLAKRSYDTTVNVTYGNLRVRATVTQNRVTGARFNLTQDIPKIKETTVLTQPKMVVFYAGLTAIGNQNNLPYASGVTLDLKLKNDCMIGIGGYITKDQPMYSASIKFPIKLRKH